MKSNDKLCPLGLKFIRSEKVCTNNAWGFGGRLGDDHYYQDEEGREYVHQTGKFYFRHLGPEVCDRVEVPGVVKRFTTKLFKELYREGGLEALHAYAKTQKYTLY
jgi:hypothetical protein